MQTRIFLQKQLHASSAFFLVRSADAELLHKLPPGASMSLAECSSIFLAVDLPLHAGAVSSLWYSESCSTRSTAHIPGYPEISGFWAWRAAQIKLFDFNCGADMSTSLGFDTVTKQKHVGFDGFRFCSPEISGCDESMIFRSDLVVQL